MTEASIATILILVSALFHASWNAILKSGDDRDALIAILNLVGAGIAVCLLGIIPQPTTTDWLWIAVSVCIHLGYQLSLARMMESADYSLVYPISRGLGPLVVTLFSIFILSTTLGGVEIVAILVLICGAVLAGFDGTTRIKALPINALSWAIVVGLLIGAYTIVDGSAAKLMNPLTFVVWSSILIMPVMMTVLFRKHGRNFGNRLKANWKRGLAMTAIGYCGYTMALYAFRLGNLAEIAALRETSIFFAAIIGAYGLKERITPLRLIGISTIAIAAVTLKLF